MPQFGFYMAGASVVTVGRLGLLIAWDPFDKGPAGADELDLSGIHLYSWVGPLSSVAPQVCKVKSKSPITLPPAGCPETLDGGPQGDFFIRFGIKAGGTGGSTIVDGWLEVFDANGPTRLYGLVDPPALTQKIELAEGSAASGAPEFSMQDRVVDQALEDPLEGWAVLLGGDIAAIDLWRELLTPDAPLKWSPI
ncbi:hypothetical protein [Spongiactinospora sp. TRM90649]|uniref:hypothetical protein n=1 Tax=Spongiactinospora sp. TRM90649 TaxID=3031114 RepID=UPI0023F7387E|nr:hypothetical protein [Spongiactinospora sp. TRM90649]MDF5758361.1 hypothetical protein [Spongiactinospora sp. TRM90649]